MHSERGGCMEISKQRCLIYRLKGWRAEAIALTEEIPAIHHSSTASRPEAFLKTFYIIDLQDVWLNLGGGRHSTSRLWIPVSPVQLPPVLPSLIPTQPITRSQQALPVLPRLSLSTSSRRNRARARKLQTEDRRLLGLHLHRPRCFALKSAA